MAIIDPEAIKFANERVRSSADKLARTYYLCEQMVDLWNSLTGNNAAKLALASEQLQRVSNRLNWTYRFCEESRILWDALVMSSLFPNDPLEVVFDNRDYTASDPNRQAITGEDVRRVNWTIEEMVNWLKYDPLVADPVFLRDGQITTEVVSYAGIKDVMKLTTDGFKSPSGNQAANLITRCTELVTEWGTTNPNRLTWLLKAAVNPNPDPLAL